MRTEKQFDYKKANQFYLKFFNSSPARVGAAEISIALSGHDQWPLIHD